MHIYKPPSLKLNQYLSWLKASQPRTREHGSFWCLQFWGPRRAEASSPVPQSPAHTTAQAAASAAPDQGRGRVGWGGGPLGSTRAAAAHGNLGWSNSPWGPGGSVRRANPPNRCQPRCHTAEPNGVHGRQGTTEAQELGRSPFRAHCWPPTYSNVCPGLQTLDNMFPKKGTGRGRVAGLDGLGRSLRDPPGQSLLGDLPRLSLDCPWLKLRPHRRSSILHPQLLLLPRVLI
jgi:hypothetical protein